ncbi:MAG TPA: hypothetical protein VFY23_01835, partial [Candidatus Limnocylindrales bacterium]|nr:hypothetical protein [Candidatus Limnocylindrales bacterium]
MRLYAHQDRAGWDRLGALVDGELITAGQLQKHERRAGALTWQSVCCLVNDVDWRRDLDATIRRASRARGKARV